MPMTRVCLGCRKRLPVSEFFPEKSARDGVGAFCWDCVRKCQNNRPRPVDSIANNKRHWTKVKPDHDKF